MGIGDSGVRNSTVLSQYSYRTHPYFFTRLCRSLLWLAALCFLTACGSQASADTRAAGLETVTSWAATAHMLADAWLAGAVPTAYATQTLEQGQHALRQKLRTRPASSPAETRPQLLEYVQELEHTLGQMQAAIARHDRAALTQQLEHLAYVKHTIMALAKTRHAQP
jgi:hypothetical protein